MLASSVVDHHVAAIRLGAEARRLDAAHLPACGQLGEPGMHLLGIEAQQRRARGHLLAFDDVDRGDTPAVRMIDHLDPIGRLDLAVGAHHLLDLGQRRPREHAAEHQGDHDDQQAGDRRMAALDHALGIGQELGQPVAVGEALPGLPQHGSDRRGARPRRVTWRLAAEHEMGDLARRALALDATVEEEQHAIGDRERAEAVRHHDDRAAARGPLEIGQQRLLGDAIERAGGLVEHEQAGVADQRARC